ncbi:hypothetical protein STRSA0001_1995 [Streptococcus salivarius SK126]|jgi:hypothetical protein|nr:hypothetical protein STRSA0001_1995 [Streptococcus salivarius SK126]
MVHNRNSSLKNIGSIISRAVLAITDIKEQFLIIQSKIKFDGKLNH